MISFKRCSNHFLLITFIFLFGTVQIHAQGDWDWHDPLDNSFFSPVDNKVIIYNGIALGLIHFLSKEKIKIKNTEKYSSYIGEWYHEYRKAPLSTVFSFKNRIGWKWKKGIWLGYELGLFGVDDDRFIPGVGMSPFFSWNIINSDKWRFSYDNGVGPIYYFQSFPEGGTRFNFYTFYGLQVERKLSKGSYAIGARNTHISNAFIAGRDRNPSFDGVGLYVEISF